MLTPAHRDELRRSGLTDGTIARAGCYSATEAGAREVLGFGAGSGLAFPYPVRDGQPAYARLKLDRADPDGKCYRSPKGQPNRLYIPPLLATAILTDPAPALWITEGEKKALKACQEGLACVALPGVWSWRTRDAHDRSVPIPDLDAVVWRGRTVFVVFDSDLATNRSVKLAEFGLARELQRRGAKVLAIRLPAGANGAKVGLDDYLVTHSVEALCALEPVEILHPDLRPGPVVVEAHDLLRRDYPEPPAIVGGGILPRQTLAVLGGPPKVGKSSLVLNLALQRSLGQCWLQFETTPGRTLIPQAEIPERELQGRLRLQLQDLGAPLPEGRLFFVTHRGLRLDRTEGLRVCRRLVEETRADCLIIDPLARFFSGDENSVREIGRLIGGLDELIQSCGVAIMLVHHTSKPTKDDPREGGLRLRGSSALFGAVDSALLLDKAASGLFRLSFELRHGKEPEPMLLRRTDTLWFEPAGPPSDLLAVAERVATIGLRYRDLVREIETSDGVSRRTAERLVARARQAGLIARDSTDIYRVTATYRHARADGDASSHE